MAKLNDRRYHITLMDSRGTGLQSKIDQVNQGEYLEVHVHNGATLSHLARAADAHLANYPFDVVYVAGGACDITTKNKITKKISFDWESMDALSAHLINTLQEENHRLLLKHPASRVVFCPLVGTDLARVVNAHTTTYCQQSMVNDTIFAYNEAVFTVNKSRGAYSPALHRTVHRSKGGNMKSYYYIPMHVRARVTARALRFGIPVNTART